MRDTIKISFVGDLMCDPYQLSVMRVTKHTFDEIFSGIGNVFKESDFVVGNLETPLAGKTKGYSTIPAYFNTPDDFAIAMKRAGIDYVTTANNHCMDRGVEGLSTTIKTLDRIGVGHTGTYDDKESSEQIGVENIKGVRVAFVAATYGFNSDDVREGVSRETLDMNEEWRIDLLKRPAKPPPCESQKLLDRSFMRRVKDKMIACMPQRLYEAICVFRNGLPGKVIRRPNDFVADCVLSDELYEEENRKRLDKYLGKLRRAHEEADVVVALPHLGGQYNPVPGQYHKAIVSKILECGVDLVVANHSHNPLPIFKTTNGVIVANSLGNFCNTPYREWFVYNSLSEYGVVLNVYIDPKLKKIVSHDFAIVKSIVDSDGFSKTVDSKSVLSMCRDAAEREKIQCEIEAVMMNLMPYGAIFSLKKT